MWPSQKKVNLIYRGASNTKRWWDEMTLKEVTRELKLEFAYHFFDYLCDTQDDIDFDEDQEDIHDSSIFGLFEKVLENKKKHKHVKINTSVISVSEFLHLRFSPSKPVTAKELDELENAITEQFKEYIESDEFMDDHDDMLRTLRKPGHVPTLATLATRRLVKAKIHENHPAHIQELIDQSYDDMVEDEDDACMSRNEARDNLLRYADDKKLF